MRTTACCGTSGEAGAMSFVMTRFVKADRGCGLWTVFGERCHICMYVDDSDMRGVRFEGM